MNTTEPMPALLEAYFADLDRALAGANARERVETIQAMREDAAEMLTRYGASEQGAERVIAEFGPVEQIAAAATPAPAPAAAASPAPRSWVDIWLLLGSIAGLLYFVFPPLAVAMLVWTVLRWRQHTGNRTLQKAALWISSVSVLVSVVLFTLHSL